MGDPTIEKALENFHHAAAHTLKNIHNLHADEPADKPAALLDHMLRRRSQCQKQPHWRHRTANDADADSANYSSADLNLVISQTGFTPTQALWTLHLRDEIGALRGEGHSTAAVIEQLSGRLSSSALVMRRGEQQQQQQQQQHVSAGQLAACDTSLPTTRKQQPASVGVDGASIHNPASPPKMFGDIDRLSRVASAEKRQRDDATPPFRRMAKIRSTPPG